MSDSEYDPSEHESDQVTYRPSTTSSRHKKNKVAGSGAPGYKIRSILTTPRPTTYSAQAIYDQILDNEIDLDPEYQRNVVWPESKQIGIIDSIFRNFYIPPIIFVVKPGEDGPDIRTCIDGKQRLTSIHRFMDGLIYYKDPHTHERFWYKDIGGVGTKKKQLLPEHLRNTFAKKQIVCIEYERISPENEREIFQRVQLGMALTPAEKLQAVNGPMTSFVRLLISTYLTSDGGIPLDWNHDRGGDFRCIANTLYMIEKFNSGTITNQGTIVQLEKWLKIALPPTEEFKKVVHETYTVLLMLVRDKALSGVFRTPARVSPIEFIMIVLFVSLWKDQLTPKQLRMGIEWMRKDVRNYHKDISQNSRVGKTLFEFIRGFKAAKVKSAVGDGGETAGQLAKNIKMDEDGAMDVDEGEELRDARTRSPPSPGEIRPSPIRLTAASIKNESNPATQIPLPPPPPKPKPDRLVAIREAKAKLYSNPSLLLPTPVRSDSGRFGLPERPVLSVNTDPLESTLLSRVNGPISSTSSTALSAGLGRAMYTSQGRRSRSRSRDKGRGRDRDRDSRRRSNSRERSPPRPSKSWDDGRNNDYRTRYRKGSPRWR